jgi:hypothetical protein
MTKEPEAVTVKFDKVTAQEFLAPPQAVTKAKANTPPDWFEQRGSNRPGPARIRVTINRGLTPAEREEFRNFILLTRAANDDKVRVADDSRIYVESSSAVSRELFQGIASYVEARFVNVFPIAVRTFRELILPDGSTPIITYEDLVTALVEPFEP